MDTPSFAMRPDKSSWLISCADRACLIRSPVMFFLRALTMPGYQKDKTLVF